MLQNARHASKVIVTESCEALTKLPPCFKLDIAFNCITGNLSKRMVEETSPVPEQPESTKGSSSQRGGRRPGRSFRGRGRRPSPKKVEPTGEPSAARETSESPLPVREPVISPKAPEFRAPPEEPARGRDDAPSAAEETRQEFIAQTPPPTPTPARLQPHAPREQAERRHEPRPAPRQPPPLSLSWQPDPQLVRQPSPSSFRTKRIFPRPPSCRRR